MGTNDGVIAQSPLSWADSLLGSTVGVKSVAVETCTCGDDTFRWLASCHKCGKAIRGNEGKKNGRAAIARDVLSHPTAEIAASYRKRAIVGARALPDELDDDLLAVWVADTRGESYSFSNEFAAFNDAKQRFSICLKEDLEAAARAGSVSIKKAYEALTKNVIWLLAQEIELNLRQARSKYCELLRSGRTESASPQELNEAVQELTTTIVDWLRSKDISFYMEPSVILAATEVNRVLRRFDGTPDLYLEGAIPEQKLANASSFCGMPNTERASAIVDCTYFGSAKNALIFGTRAIYFHNGGRSGFLPYSQFSQRTFNFRADNPNRVSLGNSEYLDLNGSQVSASICISMLEAIRETLNATSARTAQEGLATIPGMHALKKILTVDVIDVLRNADEYRRYGLALPNGLLFYGPPGCGKTFVAQRLAGELSYNFYEVTPSTIASPYIHDSVLKIKDVFERAARSAPSLIFVDEFEGLVPSRRYLGAESQYKAEEVNEWLTQIGSCSERGILFIAATNEPWKIDEAIRRTGRLDKKIYIGPPDQDAIAEMIAYNAKGRPLSDSSVFAAVAHEIRDRGYSASDLKLLVDEAAKLAMRDRSLITVVHFQKAAQEKVHPSITPDVQELFAEFR